MNKFLILAIIGVTLVIARPHYDEQSDESHISGTENDYPQSKPSDSESSEYHNHHGQSFPGPRHHGRRHHRGSDPDDFERRPREHGPRHHGNRRPESFRGGNKGFGHRGKSENNDFYNRGSYDGKENITADEGSNESFIKGALNVLQKAIEIFGKGN